MNHEFPGNGVEELLDIQIDNPVVLPAPLPAYPDRVMSRLSRPIAIGVAVKPRLHQRLQKLATTVWATLSAIVGTPSILTPAPCGLGISTALTGGGKYDPELIRFQILYRLSRRSASNSSSACPSTPGAPLFALTCRHASTRLLRNRKRLLCRPWHVLSVPPGPMARLIQTNHGEPAPSLHPHHRGILATTGRSASERRIGTQCLRFLPSAGSLSRPGHQPELCRIDLLTFRARAADQAHAASTPDTTWPIHGHPPGSSRANQIPISMPSRMCYDASTAFWKSSSWSPPDASSRLFPSLTTTVFSQRSTGWFRARPRRPTLEGHQASISRTAFFFFFFFFFFFKKKKKKKKRPCRGCSQDRPQTRRDPDHPPRGRPCWPQPAGTPPRPAAWESRTACS